MKTRSQEHDDTSSGTQTSRVTDCYEYHGAVGRQDQQIGDPSGDERRVKYDYDAAGRLTGLNWPYARGTWAGDHVDYSCFDGLGRPKTIQNCIGGSYTDLVAYTFLGHRVAVKEYPQSTPSYTVRQTFWSLDENNYDPYGRLLRSHAVSDPGGGGEATLMDIQYQYDDGGNPLWRYDALQNSGTTSWSQAYQYDVQSRLTRADEGALAGWGGTVTMATPTRTWIWDDGETYSMDKVGNFNNYYNNGMVDTREHNVANQITQRYGVAMSYDDNGNLIDNSLTFKAVYDFRNRLVQVTRQDDTLQAAYSYDGLNRRIRKTTYDADGETVLSDVRYIYDGSRVIEERDLTNYNQLVARYAYGTQYVDELVRTYRDFNADGEFTGTNETLCYLQDRLFNVVALTDVYGAVQERVFYEPYGRSTCHRISDDDETVGSHFGNPYLFTGRELDSETCFYNYRARYYSPMLCRFLNRDPIAADRNLYRYVGNNPVRRADPTGDLDIDIPDYIEHPEKYPNEEGVERIDDPGPPPQKCVKIPRNRFEKWYADHGGTLTQDQKDRLDRGCIGLAAISQANNRATGPYQDFPEDAPGTMCYTAEDENSEKSLKEAEQKAKDRKCCPGEQNFVFAKQGAWANGAPTPKPDGNDKGTVPVGSISNAGGHYNYITVAGATYWWMNFCAIDASPGDPQWIKICLYPNPNSSVYPHTIWCSTCRKPTQPSGEKK